MAGRKLTDAERENFAARNAASKASSAAAKAKAAGIDPKTIKSNTRSADQIMSDIEKVKQDPKFQKSMEKFKAAQIAKGTQVDHHVTAGGNVTKGLSSGGVLGLALSGMATYNEEAKRISDAKKQVKKQVN